MSLICGLLVGLTMAVPGATFAADSSAAAANPVPTSRSVSTWKSTGRVSSVDIRFRKPEGTVFTDMADGATSAPNATTRPTKAAAPAGIPAAVPAQVKAPTTAQSQAPAAKAPQAPAAATTVAQPASAAPTTAAPASATLVTNAATAAPTAPASATTVHADDQIQLVARLLMDQGVVRAAQEESLPASPDAVAPTTTSGHPADSIDGYAGGECCPDQCCPPAPRLFWVGGVEATFLVPDLNSDGVDFTVQDIQNDRFDKCSTQDVDIDDMYASPRIWLGVQGCCWGANVRYWHLQASEGTYDPSIGGLGTWDDFDCGRPDLGFFSCNRLEAYTVDLEITRRFCIHDCWMQAALGVRHAEIENHENITGLALTDAGLLNGFARADRMSRGTGLLLGLYGRKPIFPCSCVHWFYNARWSAMWGPTQTSAETFAAATSVDPDFVASAASVNGAYSTVDDTLFVGEIQLGLEWDYALCCLPANAFWRVAVEYQRWDGGRGFSGADSFAGIEIDDGSSTVASLVGTAAAAGEPQMDLLGFTIGTGLTW